MQQAGRQRAREAGAIGARARGLAAAFAVVALAVVMSAPPADAKFERKRTAAAELNMFDLGVTDADNDGRLDIFTLNHTYPDRWLLNQGGFRFSNGKIGLGLSPTPRFPGIEQTASDPRNKGAGLYVFYRRVRHENRSNRPEINLRARGTRVSGRLSLLPKRPYWGPSSEGGATAQIHEGPDDALYMDFEMPPGSALRLISSLSDLPVRVDAEMNRGRLYVGRNAVSATGGRAVFSLRDRHAWAQADLAGGSREDLFEVIGGMGGKIAHPPYHGRSFDRIYRGGSDRYRLETTGVDKGTCRGRDAGAAHIDGNGLVDLFTSCDDGPARALLQRPDGSFRAEEIPDSEGDAYLWITDGVSGRPALAVADRDGLRVLRRDAGGAWNTLTRSRLLSRPRASTASERVLLSVTDPDVLQIVGGDANRDGRLDLFVVSKYGNTLLLGKPGGGFTVRRPRKLGLPRASVGASWVDYDNDGRLDLHALPQGLFRATARGYRRTGRLSVEKASSGVANWGDFDNDGRRDVVWASGTGFFAAQHKIRLHRNLHRSRGGWLQVDTPGAQKGARITLRARGRRAVTWAGLGEGSRYSQTHNRNYLAVGRRARRGPAELTIRWVTGEVTERRIRLNRRLRLSP